LFFVDGGEEEWEIHEAAEGAVEVFGDDLVEVGRFVEATYGIDGLWVARIERKGVGKVDFGEADVVFQEGIECEGGVVEFDGEVAAVEVQTDSLGEAGWCGFFRVQAMEERDGFRGVFEVAEGFGFEAQVEIDLVGLGQLIDVGGEFDQVFADEGFVGGKGFVGARECGDGATGGFRCDLGDDLEEILGVGDAFVGCPVREEDLLFDASAVEGAVGEAVDGEDAAVVRFEPVFEFLEILVLEKFVGGDGGEAQADGVGCSWGLDA